MWSRVLGIFAPILLAGLGLLGCAFPRHEVEAPRPTPEIRLESTPETQTNDLILITLDGVRWQDVFGGVNPSWAEKARLPERAVVGPLELMPHLYSLARRGIVSGAPGYGPPMRASGPNYVSLPGYTEIFTGHPSRCGTNLCGRTTIPTILDTLRNKVIDNDAGIAVFSSWEVYANAVSVDPRHMLVSAGRTSGTNRERALISADAKRIEREAKADPVSLGSKDYRKDRFTEELALAYMHEIRPRVLVVGLGDTDEYAHLTDYAGYIKALKGADDFIGKVIQELEQQGRLHTTSIIVTTDHGREAGFSHHGFFWPESDRVWMVAAGGSIPATGYQTDGRFERLHDIAPFIYRLMVR